MLFVSIRIFAAAQCAALKPRRLLLATLRASARFRLDRLQRKRGAPRPV
jgi:hypothetical protein